MKENRCSIFEALLEALRHYERWEFLRDFNLTGHYAIPESISCAEKKYVFFVFLFTDQDLREKEERVTLTHSVRRL